MSGRCLRRQSALEQSFILMDFLEGVEMGVGAYFNGAISSSRPASTGSTSGSFPVISANSPAKWARSSPIRARKSFFDRTLGAMRPLLQAARLLRLYQSQHHRERARHLAARIHLPVRLSRLRHPRSVAANVLGRPSSADAESAAAIGFEAEPGFAVGIVVTTPPFPYSRGACCRARRPAYFLRWRSYRRGAAEFALR